MTDLLPTILSPDRKKLICNAKLLALARNPALCAIVRALMALDSIGALTSEQQRRIGALEDPIIQKHEDAIDAEYEALPLLQAVLAEAQTQRGRPQPGEFIA